MDFIFPAAPQPSLAIHGSQHRFPVRRIFCVGQNYLAHVLELGNAPGKPPFFFCKPNDTIVPDGAHIDYPMATDDLHHEAELVVAIGKAGARIPEIDARHHVWGYGVGIDLTRRDLQSAAKKAGKPWDMAKGFDQSAPCGALHPVAECGHPDAGRISLKVNDEIRQDSDISDMIWSVPAIIAHLSGYCELMPGDLIYTGTPSGVGPVQPGDHLAVAIDGLGTLSVTVGQSGLHA